ncbi:hypothetical protein AB4865_12485 [Capnocytophaga sp. ARDL2]|uniref:hypothetical protein n=1 Tax=Capnocytophaga sp. ARDL2 TaxID=3238809 RepID=UPI00355716B9
MSRNDIDRLLWDILPQILSDIQMKNRIGNYLTELRKAGKIKNQTKRGNESNWVSAVD